MKESKKEKDSKPHFVEIIDYSPQETWRTDILIGQRNNPSHGHLALSGVTVWYLRDEQGMEIVVNGSVIPNNTFKRKV